MKQDKVVPLAPEGAVPAMRNPPQDPEKGKALECARGLMEVAALAPVPKQTHVTCEQMYQFLTTYLGKGTGEEGVVPTLPETAEEGREGAS